MTRLREDLEKVVEQLLPAVHVVGNRVGQEGAAGARYRAVQAMLRTAVSGLQGCVSVLAFQKAGFTPPSHNAPESIREANERIRQQVQANQAESEARKAAKAR